MLLGDAAAPDQLGMPARTEVVLLDLEPSPSSTRKLPSFAEPPRNGSAGRRSSGIQKLAAAPDSGESDQTLPPPSNRPAQADLHDDSLRTSLDTPLSEALMRDLAPQPQSWARSKAPARNGAGSAVPTTPSSTAGVGNASRLAPPLHQDEGETIDASDASAAMVLEARAVARGMQLAGGAIPAEVPATPNDTWADLIPPLPRNVGDELRGIHDTPVDAGRLRGWNELQTFEDCTVPLFLDTNPAAGASASERDTVPPFRPQPPQAAQEPIAARGRAEADHATVRDTRMPSIAQRMPVPDSGDDERFEPIGKPQRADGILRRVEPRGTPSPDRTERLDPPPHDLHDDAAESSTRRNLPRPTHEEATTDPHPHQGRGMWLPHHVVLLAIAAAFLAGMITGLIVSAML
jgi:hypothetical protein